MVLHYIGATIGWFSLMEAYSCNRAVAIESLIGNVNLFLHSLCLAPHEVRDRITLLHYGLDMRDGGIFKLRHEYGSNQGNINIICNANMKLPRRKRKLGTTLLFKLDSLIVAGILSFASNEKEIVKIDTEGFEPFASLGADRFLHAVHPAFIYSEFSNCMIRRAAMAMKWSQEKAPALPNNFIKMMHKQGYSLTKPISNPYFSNITLGAQAANHV